MKRVIIESPYAGNVERNVSYARACLLHSLTQGEAPFASHLLYTQLGVLQDALPTERMLGMHAGWAWMKAADLIAVYTDLGMTPGMKAGISRAINLKYPIEYRRLPSYISYIIS